MQKKFGMKEVSELLGIPKPTLRYWDSQGLISLERREENRYRQFSVQAAIDIGDVAFYRSLDIPVKELKRWEVMSVEEIRVMLENAEKQNEKKILDLIQKKQRISNQSALVEEVFRLKAEEYKKGVPDINILVEYKFDNQRHWKKTLEEPNCFALYWSKTDSVFKDSTIISAVADFQESGDNVLFQQAIGAAAKLKEDIFLECLIQVDVKNSENNNLERHFKQVRNMGYEPELVLGRYLITAWDQVRWDYYRGWIKVNAGEAV